MRTPHTACRKGKRVQIILRDGRRIIDHFEGRTDRWVILREIGRVMKADIRAFMIFKGNQNSVCSTGGSAT